MLKFLLRNLLRLLKRQSKITIVFIDFFGDLLKIFQLLLYTLMSDR